ncbi:MAG: copper homeostasis protein CutC [Eubacteriales bacterium]|nr:copper homeostasis protein CutC [Eubacteriales bacterium]
MSKRYLLECCVDSVKSARCAKEGGADRLELCANLVIGGTTPSLALYEQIRESMDIRIHALIRPRFGDFLYDSDEADVICREISAFRKAGADGVVIGSLNPDGSLNPEQLKRFLDCAGQMSVTLHRAFDMCRDPFEALEQAKALGIDTILTSGQAASCLEGMELLQKLEAAAGTDIALLAGAGINEAAVRTLLAHTGLTRFHMSGKTVLNSRMQYRNPAVSMGLPGLSEYEIWQTDSQAVRSVRALLDAAQ